MSKQDDFYNRPQEKFWRECAIAAMQSLIINKKDVELTQDEMGEIADTSFSIAHDMSTYFQNHMNDCLESE